MSNWRIINGNAYEAVITNKIDALVSDPPYGQGYKPGRTGTAERTSKGMRLINRQWEMIEGEDRPFDPAPFLGYPLVLLWGANHYADKLPARSGWLIWDKRGNLPSNDQSDCEMAWTNRDRAARIYRLMWSGVIRGGEENIAVSGDKLHPHLKPVSLMMWCLEQLGLTAGCTVYDPFMGSGTTGVACLRLGINFVGCEIDDNYCDIAHQRLSKAELQAPLLVDVARHEQLSFEAPS